MSISPAKIQELPPPSASVKAAGPAKEYHSDSAESLTEIPVSSTRTGGNINASPGDLFNNNFSRNTLPSAKKVSTKKKHSSSSKKPLSPSDSQKVLNINNNYNSSMNGDVNVSGPPHDTLLSSTLGATDVSMGTRTLPETEILDGKPPLRRQRSHKDVPPLDLSELSGNSDNEITGSHTGGKKRKKKSLVTMIWVCSIPLRHCYQWVLSAEIGNWIVVETELAVSETQCVLSCAHKITTYTQCIAYIVRRIFRVNLVNENQNIWIKLFGCEV